jgi:uncharacterized membrane protein YhaH (DUF805 family)
MGRVNRAEYWLLLVVMAAIVAVFSAAFGKLSAIVAPCVLVAIPRLHDLGKSGKWALLAFPIYFGPMLFVEFTSGDSAYGSGIAMAEGIGIGLLLALVLTLAIPRGQPGTNKWGSPPPPGINFRLRKA